MSFWPTDTAGQIADVVSVFAFLASGIAAIAASRSGSAVRKLEKKFERRDLLPPAVERYQELYRELQPLLNNRSADPAVISQRIGELKGMLNGLETYLNKDEKRTLKVIRKRLVLIGREPKAPNHLQDLLSDTGTFAVELSVIVGRVTWNSQS